jgi:hypothetical protein
MVYLVNNNRCINNTRLFEDAYHPPTGARVLTSLYPEQETQCQANSPGIGDRCWYAFRCNRDSGQMLPWGNTDTHSCANIALYEIVDLPTVVPLRAAVERYQLQTTPAFRPERRKSPVTVGEFCGENQAFGARQKLVVGRPLLGLERRVYLVDFDDRLNPDRSVPGFFTINGHWQQFSIRYQP